MWEDLFSDAELAAPPQPVLMSLNPEYYELVWQRLKTHEFRRRYLTDRASTWYVYLTAPVSRLTAVIDLDSALVDTPERIAEIAERIRTGNGQSVYEYLKDLKRGFALPIRRVREYGGFTATELREMLGSFHPPQGYTLVARHPAWGVVCDTLTSGEPVREMTVHHQAGWTTHTGASDGSGNGQTHQRPDQHYSAAPGTPGDPRHLGNGVR